MEVLYHVGSKNELAGRTGFAHLFEHVMFTGSGHVPYGLHDKLTEGVGGSNNGTTSNDRTNYYETVPSNYLETALWLESDRMGFLLDSLDLDKLNAQRDIVKNERRQGVRQPAVRSRGRDPRRGDLPASHPYSWDVIGSMDDLSAATDEDVKKFFRLYYAPNNAILAIVGDFDTAQTKAWIRNTSATSRAASRSRVRRSRRSSLRGREAPRVRGSRAGAASLRPVADGGREERRSLALDVLGAILAGPRTARLTKALVYDKQTAASVGVARTRTRTSASSG